MTSYDFGSWAAALLVTAFAAFLIYQSTSQMKIAVAGAVLFLLVSMIDTYYDFGWIAWILRVAIVAAAIATGLKVKKLKESIKNHETDGVASEPTPPIVGANLINLRVEQIANPDASKGNTPISVAEPSVSIGDMDATDPEPIPVKVPQPELVNQDAVYCTKCGTKCTKDMTFCYRCGNKLRVPKGEVTNEEV